VGVVTPVVVVGVDRTAGARAAVEAAAAEARRRNARLRIVCCWSVPGMSYAGGLPPIESIETLLLEDSELCLANTADAISRGYPELELETRSVWAPVTTGLVAASKDAALLVLGSRRRRGLARFVFGSVSRQISRRAACPVRIVAPR
jgi:nucleotide-binding universal stress UspA family protein